MKTKGLCNLKKEATMIIRCTYCADEGEDSYVGTSPPLYCPTVAWGVCERHRKLFDKEEKRWPSYIQSEKMEKAKQKRLS